MAPGYRSTNSGWADVVQRFQPRIAFIVMIFGALIAFEIFNYSTTDHALKDLLGDLRFIGIPWATILALAFCGIDFAGIARLFTPEQGSDEPKEVWYLFGAWLLAATMNAILTWWGVAMAVANHPIQSSSVINAYTVTHVVPVFVAVLVWLIRILIIGTLSVAMDRMMHTNTGVVQHLPAQQPMPTYSNANRQQRPAAPAQQPMMNAPAGLNSAGTRPSLSRAASASQGRLGRGLENSRGQENSMMDDPAQTPVRSPRPDPTYHSMSMSARKGNNRPGINGSSENGDNSRRYR